MIDDKKKQHMPNQQNDTNSRDTNDTDMVGEKGGMTESDMTDFSMDEDVTFMQDFDEFEEIEDMSSDIEEDM